VIRTGKHSYQLAPFIDISEKCSDIVGRLITTQPEFYGTKDFAIGKAKKMLEDVENWPKY
jgi:hypothetical protein